MREIRAVAYRPGPGLQIPADVVRVAPLRMQGRGIAAGVRVVRRIGHSRSCGHDTLSRQEILQDKSRNSPEASLTGLQA